ncbi:hypothetical protein [Aquamicrobium soli]|jgi:hypothetical protein|uniref:Uncharacterized protein n=1 Tax=Aquamicrobium soli TaxID=1811518 RepID=A0ABV7KIT4_9HYPH
MGGVAMGPRQINPFDVRGWFDHEIDLPLRLGSADGALPVIRQSDQSPRGHNGAWK